MLGLIVVILIGLFCIFCAIMNFSWFIEGRKARIFVKMFGKTGARIFYVVFGIAIIILALWAHAHGRI